MAGTNQPFDLNTFPFTVGDDEVKINVSVEKPTNDQVAIFNTAPVNTRAGDDVISGHLFARNSDERELTAVALLFDLRTAAGDDEVIGFTRSTKGVRDETIGIQVVEGVTLDTGSGADLVRGIGKTVDGTDDVSADITGATVGILVTGNLVTRAGDDIVDGIATAAGSGELGPRGIRGFDIGTISTGAGDDLVSGVATSTFDTATPAIGIIDTDIDTGAGDDHIEGVGTATGVDRSQARGLEGGELSTGAGMDTLTGLASAVADETGEALAFGVRALTFASVAGDDRIVGVGAAAVGDTGLDATGAETAVDDDVIEASAEVVGAALSGNSLAVGIGTETSDTSGTTGAGDDDVVGVAAAAGGESAIAVGIVNTELRTGAGDDRVVGVGAAAVGVGDASAKVSVDLGGGAVAVTADANGSGGSVGGALGIFDSDIRTGGGNDTVVAAGRATDGLAEGGIVDSTIDLGAGDDFVSARGDTQGLSEATILGRGGDDTFDLQSGTGSVDGGGGVDLLILEGDSTAFDFTDNGGSSGTITGGPDGVTDLAVNRIEDFEFDNGTFSFGDLFVA